MHKRKKILNVVLFSVVFALIIVASPASFALEEKIDITPAIDTLPSEIKDVLPEKIDLSPESLSQISELFGANEIIDISVGVFRSALSSALSAFAFIAALTLISASASSLGNAFSTRGTPSSVWTLAGTLCIGCCAYSMIWSHVGSVIEFSKNISSFTKALGVAMGAVYTSAGEISSAATHGVWIFSITAVCEELCGKFLLPIMQISFASTLASSAMSGVNISRLVQMIRNTFTSLLVFLMTVISVILSFQTVIAHSSDTLAMRGVRYAISHSVPIIGALVSDSARTLVSSFSLMKNSIGFFGIVIILLLSLYPLLSLVVTKYSLQLAASFSSMISEDKSTVFLDESVKMINFLIATVILLAVAFIFCLSLFSLMPSGI